MKDLPELVPPLALGQLAGQHEVGVEVVGDEGGGQGPEVQLEDGGHAVDVVEHRTVRGEVRHPLVVEQVPGCGGVEEGQVGNRAENRADKENIILIEKFAKFL